MNKLQFCLDKQKKYVIYGAGGDGRKLLSALQNCNIIPVAIIDKRAEEIVEINNVPVMDYDSWRSLKQNAEEIVVIITIKNVFEHTDIARGFCKDGYCQLVYKPLPLLQGEKGEQWDSIGESYETMVAKNRFPLDMLVRTTKTGEMLVFKDVLGNKRLEKERIVWMPTELLFNYDIEEAWGKMGMELFFPIVGLYQSLLNFNSQSWKYAKEAYFLYCGEYLKKNNLILTEKQKRSFIESRVNVFYEMEKKYGIAPDFFVESAPKAALGENGCFFLVASGRNRVAFQVAKGCSYLPIRISEEDFIKWNNQSKFEEVKELLQQVDCNHVFAPIAHPLLAGYPAVATNYSGQVCRKVAQYFIEKIYMASRMDEGTFQTINVNEVQKRFSTLKLGIWVKDEGTLSRYLSRNGLAHEVIESSAIDMKLSRAYDSLLGISQKVARYRYDNMNWGMLDYLVLDSRLTERLPPKYVGNTVFLIHWENTSTISGYIGDIFEIVEIFFFAIWEGKEVTGYLLKRKGDA